MRCAAGTSRCDRLGEVRFGYANNLAEEIEKMRFDLTTSSPSHVARLRILFDTMSSCWRPPVRARRARVDEPGGARRKTLLGGLVPGAVAMAPDVRQACAASEE